MFPQQEYASAEAAFEAGCRLDAQGNLKAALSAFTLAAQKQPENSQYWQALAVVNLRLGRGAQALDASQRALSIAPNDPDLLFAFAFVLQSLGRHHQAIDVYRNVLVQQADYRGALLNLPLLLADIGRLAEAVDILHQGLALYPEDADLYFNLGNLLVAECEYEAALEAYRHAHAIDGSMVRARLAAAFMVGALGDIANASNDIDEIAATFPEILSTFLSPLKADQGRPVMARGMAGFSLLAGYERLKCANWRSRSSLVRNFGYLVECELHQFSIDTPEYLFLSLALEMPSSVRARLAEKIALRIASETTNECFCDDQSAPELAGRKVRLAYISADFRRHPLYDVFQPVLKLHDRHLFEIILFSTGPDDASNERKSLRELADHFIDLHGLDDQARARQISREKPDILVDLSGYTVLGSPSVMALRPAKIQFSYAGFLGSMGGAWIDYAILDRNLLSSQQERNFWSERIAYLPVFPFVRPARAVDVLLEGDAQESDAGTADFRARSFVFCAFHSTWKVNPESFSLWMDILRRSSNTVLWLLADNERVRRNYLAAAREHGISPERLQFAPPLTHREHLLRLGRANLFLDTLGCGAHATAGEALVLGLPLLTLPGRTVHERYAAALLLDAGLSELVADTRENYIDFAVRMATSSAFYHACRARVAEAFSPDAIRLHDRRCVRSLEQTFRTALLRHQQGKAPDDIEPGE